MKRILFALALMALSVTSCGDTENEFTIGVCLLVIDNATHQDPTLASAMNANAPGTFCLVKKETKNGATYFTFTNNAGLSSSKIQNAIDQRRSSIIGYNNGIIVGFGALSNPATFYAYDHECPNCFDPNAIPMKSRPLSMSSSGQATCAVCHRQYDLNNNGFISSGEAGKRLTRYRANTTGPFGVLSVN